MNSNEKVAEVKQKPNVVKLSNGKFTITDGYGAYYWPIHTQEWRPIPYCFRSKEHAETALNTLLNDNNVSRSRTVSLYFDEGTEVRTKITGTVEELENALLGKNTTPLVFHLRGAKIDRIHFHK